MTVSKEKFAAVLFDLDGVLTATAMVHAACWKKMFDQFLEQLRSREVQIEGRLLEWKRGRHAWIRDLDGNRVELYEEIR